jgi:hypothetical protein
MTEAEALLLKYLHHQAEGGGIDISNDFSQGIGCTSSLSSDCFRKILEISKDHWLLPARDLREHLFNDNGSINFSSLHKMDPYFHSINLTISLLLSSCQLFHQTKYSTDPLSISLEDKMTISLINCSIIENIFIQFMQSKDPSGAIILFKDALLHESLSQYVPPSFIQICRYLFLPSGLNLRNLIWHGFLSSQEFESKYFYLFISIRLTCEELLKSQNISLTFRPFSQRHSVYSPFHIFKVPFQTLPASSLLSISPRSLFLLPIHYRLTLSALNDFQSGNHLHCILKLLPALEHSLRYLFCLCNRLPEYLVAQENTYYSTLDGFGQRSKHQLLLDPFLHPRHHTNSPTDFSSEFSSSTSRNHLPDVLGTGAYSLLVDLFFSDAGTNLRSKFAHDEMNLSRFANQYFSLSSFCGSCGDYAHLESVSSGWSVAQEEAIRVYLEEMSLVLLVLFFGLSQRFDLANGESQRLINHYLYPPSTPSLPSLSGFSPPPNSSATTLFHDCSLFLDTWRSHFHPHRMLSQLILTSFQSASSARLALLSRQISFPESRQENQSTGGASDETKVQILVTERSLSSDEEKDKILQIWEKDARISALLTAEDARLLCGSPTLCASKPLRDRLLPLLSAPLGGEDSGKRGRPPPEKPTVARMAANISELCLSATATLLRKVVEGQREERALSLQTLLILCHNSLMSGNSFFLRQDSGSDSTTPGETWPHTQELFLRQLSEFLDRQLDLSSLLLPGIACCGQICKVPPSLLSSLLIMVRCSATSVWSP